MKKTTILYLIALCLGAVFCAAGITLFALNLKSADILTLIICLLMAVGGGVLLFSAYQGYDKGKMEAAAPTEVKKKSRPTTEDLRAKTTPAEKSKLSQLLRIVILLLAAVVFLVFYQIAGDIDKAPKSSAVANLQYESAEVLRIVDENYRGNQIMEDRPQGEQYVDIRICTGEHKGKEFSYIRNSLSVFYGTILEEGDRIIVAIAEDGTSVTIDSEYIYDYDRTIPLIIILALFLLATVLVGGKIGAKSLLGLGLTILCVFAILFPLLIGGWPTLPTILGLCAYVTVVEFVITGGVNKKILCAILGTISGVAIAMFFGELSASLLRLTGYQMKDAAGEIEALGQLRQTQDIGSAIQLNDLLVGGILIATLGAVNDVAMSISSAMNELVAVNPNLTRKELFKSGMNIGRDMVGTMTNTLILALVGGSFVEILYYSSLDLSFYELMSTTYFPVELMQAVASSIGVVLAVPLSVLFGMLFFGKKHKS